MTPQTATATAGVRTQRADARRNRERILVAARRQFAANGLEAQMDDIARAADLGVGTVYRHFPTKEALLQALAADRFIRLTEWAREALEVPDAWEGFRDYLRRSAELGANDRLLSEAMAERDAFQGAQREKDDLMEATAALVERAQAAGELRPDIRAQDIAMLMCGLGRATGPGSFDHATSWERYLEIIVAGLRAPASSPLP
ncbi:MAG: helix-turn-helix domain-containing protein [Actinomycetota bacterium]